MRLMAGLRRAAETKGSVGGAQPVAVLARDDVSHPVEPVVRVGRGRGAVVSEGRTPPAAGANPACRFSGTGLCVSPPQACGGAGALVHGVGMALPR